MIDLKNRCREAKTYQYPRDVSAGPVRPQVINVHRGHLNPKNGVVTVQEKAQAIGGVLHLPPRGEVTRLPDALLNHPVLQRDIEARLVVVRKYPNPTTAASVAPVEEPEAPAAKPAGPQHTSTKRRRR